MTYWTLMPSTLKLCVTPHNAHHFNAQMTETGKLARDYFKQGELRHIKKLKYWPLEKVLTEKYQMPVDEVG